MKQTILPARHWYQTDNGKWASREKMPDDRAADRQLITSLGIGEPGSLNDFTGITPALEKAADAMLALGQFENPRVTA